MSPEQLAEIEARWWNPFRLGDLPKNGLDDVSDLLAEVRKLQEKLQYEETCHVEAQEEVRRLNRIVDRAVDYLEHSCCDAPQSFDCEEINRDCRDCWKEYLESEVGNNG